MNTIGKVNVFCSHLMTHSIKYHVDIVRNGAIMVSLAVPGQRWEIEFCDDDTIEFERFVTTGVVGCPDPLSLVLEQYE